MPEKHQPDTLAEMTPLFQAVHHGCQAGRWQDALEEVYDRIVRTTEDYTTNEDYLVRKLGAVGADLGLLASFFDPPFVHPATGLTESDRAWFLNQAAYRLRALGRLREAVAPMQAGLEMAVEQENWTSAAARAANLSELQLALGDVVAAEALGEAAIDYADRSGDDFQRIFRRTDLASVSHQKGATEAAQALFDEAERMQVEHSPDHAFLYSYRGYQYCDLLLTLGQAEAVRERARLSLEWATSRNELLSIALDRLSLGRAALALGDRDKARSQLDRAADGLRASGNMDELPRGLLTHAAFFRAANDSERARKDLDEAMRIATRCSMRLHQCDAHLEYARLALAEDNPDAARPHLKSAAALVRDCGYYRRDPEIAELEETLGR